MHKSMVSRAVARLMELGWVARTDGARDRREAPLVLTAAGCAVYDQLVPIVLDYQDRLLASLDASERRLLERLLGKLEHQLDLPCRPARPGRRPGTTAGALPEPSSRGAAD
jgi:DNA-binding MarR family transcriptional regulator